MWILWNRKSSRPSRLNLRAYQKNLPDLAKNAYNKYRHGEKNLDCLFMYNGHEFNAYEVLGIPAGAPIEMAESAFKSLSKTNYKEYEFFKAALEALKKS